MNEKSGHFEHTIIVTEDPNALTRGFSLMGREFRLKEREPRKDVGLFQDGAKIEAEFWVITKYEFMLVVPEMRKVDFDSDEIYIPTVLAKPSFRPVSLKSKKI